VIIPPHVSRGFHSTGFASVRLVGAAQEEAGRVVYSRDDFLGTIALSSYRFG
jgi:hypothetical protein